ncbi:hypothetical protein DXG03_002751 [Asterophora parasitica]|uniref:J domain-containing protein n=1 Tax=Asterophora parasitica TaxID=117018 RepID=A0A9P7G2M1_9AGAR|nr:hypothetical protein DXG03_002751 [Asterophora parasitica]
MFFDASPPPATPSRAPTPRRRPPSPLGPIPRASSPPARQHIPRAMGYFAFPPPASPGSGSTPASPPNPNSTPPDTRLQAEIALNEFSWVASGGILRSPSSGRRDMVRTEAVRAEIRLRRWEADVQARWQAYERAWKGLLGGKGGMLAFGDIPWPVHVVDVRDGEGDETMLWLGAGEKEKEKRETKTKRSITLADLTPAAIERFLLESLGVRGCEVTRRERVRAQLLRWHPDKCGVWIGRAGVRDQDEDEREMVREGVRRVGECLLRMNINANG